MRAAVLGMLMLSAATAANAAEIAIGGPYGNDAGCALLVDAPVIPPGIGLIVMPGYVATEQTVCLFETVTAEGPGWRVQARCVQNQTIRYRSEFAVLEEPDRGAINIAAISTSAPQGRYPACQAAPAPRRGGGAPL